MKRASSPAHKASLKRLGIPEITHLSPGRGLGASGLQLGAKSIPFLRVIQMEMENHLKMRGMGVGEVNTCYYQILFNGKEKKMHL